MQSVHSLKGSREVLMMQTHAQCTLSLLNIGLQHWQA